MVRFKIVREGVSIPEYKTDGSIGFDLSAAIDVTVPAKASRIIPTGLIIEAPYGTMLMLTPRSSTFKRTGLIMPHSVGVIDQDYSGDDDEIGLQFLNIVEYDVRIKKGDRLAQGIFVVAAKPVYWEQQREMGNSRGGFGSTGIYG